MGFRVETVVKEAQILDELAKKMNYRDCHVDPILCGLLVVSVDQLLEHLLDLTEHDEVEKGLLVPVFERRFALTMEDLSTLSQHAIPLAVMRELIARHHLILRKNSMRNWEKFSLRYHEAIFA